MRTLALAAGLMLCSATALAQDTTSLEVPGYYPTAELGVQAGQPTGFSGKYWLSPWSAIQAGFTWRLPDEGYSFSLDYVAHSYWLHNSMREPAGVKMPLYAGAGVKALKLSSDHPVVGARFPLGVAAMFSALPVSIFAEVAPGAVFEDKGPVFSADAGVGARVYF